MSHAQSENVDSADVPLERDVFLRTPQSGLWQSLPPTNRVHLQIIFGSARDLASCT